MPRRQHGTGSIIKLKHLDKETGETVESRFWYILYRANGRQVRESSESESRMVAEKMLQRRMGEAGLGLRPQQQVKGVKYEDVRDALIAEYKNKGRSSVLTHKDGTDYVCGVDHLDAFFAGYRVVGITADSIRRFIDQRRKAGSSDPTIRRTLVLLRSMLNLARKEGKLRLADIPHFPMPPDSKPRTGFVNPDVFVKLRAGLPKHLHALITFLYYTGCRLGAAQKITWDMVASDCSEIRLPGEITKSGEPLTLPLVGEGLKDIAALMRKMSRNNGPVFDATNLRKEWATACNALGLGVKKGWTYEGLTLHDLRRSAVRNLIRAGVREDVAMSISGHKTRAVFSRYNITDQADIKVALVKVGEYAKIQTRQAKRARRK